MKEWTDKDEKALEELQTKKDAARSSYADAVRNIFAKAGANMWRGDSPTFVINNGQVLLDLLIQYFEPSPPVIPNTKFNTLAAFDKPAAQTLTPAQTVGVNKIREALLAGGPTNHPLFPCSFDLPDLRADVERLRIIIEKLAVYDIHFKDIPLDRAIEAEKVLDTAISETGMYTRAQQRQFTMRDAVFMVNARFHSAWVRRVTELTPQVPLKSSATIRARLLGLGIHFSGMTLADDATLAEADRLVNSIIGGLAPAFNTPTEYSRWVAYEFAQRWKKS